ncbi:MAG: YncE family protein [Pseudomarimonas sp.]
MPNHTPGLAMLRTALATLLTLASFTGAAEVPFVNWENHPIRALDISPDGRLLAVAHTADQRVQLFDISSGAAVAAGHVVVGVDPVAVKFRNDAELWVVNHISDSVSIVDVAARRVRDTLATDDEPFDVVFAQGRAFVSCSQVNRVLVFDAADPGTPQRITINGEDPRALAVSADGRQVYVAIFESGNASTLLGGGLMGISVGVPNVVSDQRGPYGGVNPPPNAGSVFDPPRIAGPAPPAVGLIVKKDGGGRWRDDNGSDWTRFVSGVDAAASGRRPGWDLPDRDVAIIDSQTLEVRYARGLMNMVMAMAVNPVNGQLTVVGTDALNEVRFEPNVNSHFVRVNLATVDATGSTPAAVIRDLNPHLTYAVTTLPTSQRSESIGDPRAVVWQRDGQRAWVAGLGSNNVVAINASGQRMGSPIKVGEGPVGLALDETRGRLYVWNHFEASLSTIDVVASAVVAERSAFNPLPAAIRNGRALLYDTQLTSGLGQAACGSCHVDARMDRLAWDLGDPSQPSKAFNQNCVTQAIRPCTAFHSMKGPMTTQTLQDIIGHEPHHWRGDREGIEAFNPAFEGLLGNHRQLTANEMQAFEDFLASIVFPPNPFRALDNTLPTALSLEGHHTSGRFAMAGLPLGVGNAQRGLQLYTSNLLDPPFQCSSCHTLPTGMASNAPLLLPQLGLPVGGTVMAHGPMGENHLGIVSTDGSTNISIKTPQLRNQYEKVGFDVSQLENNAGFGFLHDGSVDSIARFLSANVFGVRSDQDLADLVALMLAFSGSEFPAPVVAPPQVGTPPVSRDSHAAVGHQFTLAAGAAPASFDTLLTLVRSGKIDLIVRAGDAGYAYDRVSEQMLSDDGSGSLQTGLLRGMASATSPQTWTAVPAGLGRRLGIDRDGDGIANRVEIKQGSNPADETSTSLLPATGLWFNPGRTGHGLDVQLIGATLAVTWYTYDDAGEPTWYLAVAPFSNPWRAELQRYVWNPAGGNAVASTVGELTMNFSESKRSSFNWRLGTRSGTEPMQTLFDAPVLAAPEKSGVWFDANEPGWGLSLFTAGDLLSAGLYFYDAANQPRWVLGVGNNQASVDLSMQSYRGACPDCAFVPPVVAAGGTVGLTFAGGRIGTVRTDAFHAASPTAPWRRGPVAIMPLSDPPRFPERE